MKTPVVIKVMVHLITQPQLVFAKKAYKDRFKIFLSLCGCTLVYALLIIEYCSSNEGVRKAITVFYCCFTVGAGSRDLCC